MLFRRLREDVAQMKETLNSINTALIVREPGTARASEAYDGLRRQVAAATTERRNHLLELVRMLEALDSQASRDQLRILVGDWAGQAGLQRWDDTSVTEFFDHIGDGDGPVEIVNSAWVIGDPAALVKAGLVRRRPLDQVPVPDDVRGSDGRRAVDEVTTADAEIDG